MREANLWPLTSVFKASGAECDAIGDGSIVSLTSPEEHSRLRSVTVLLGQGDI